jgi:hypothetical protein
MPPGYPVSGRRHAPGAATSNQTSCRRASSPHPSRRTARRPGRCPAALVHRRGPPAGGQRRVLVVDLDAQPAPGRPNADADPPAPCTSAFVATSLTSSDGVDVDRRRGAPAGLDGEAADPGDAGGHRVREQLVGLGGHRWLVPAPRLRQAPCARAACTVSDRTTSGPAAPPAARGGGPASGDRGRSWRWSRTATIATSSSRVGGSRRSSSAVAQLGRAAGGELGRAPRAGGRARRRGSARGARRGRRCRAARCCRGRG